MKISKAKLGRNIRSGRERLGMSVEEMAYRLGESTENVMKIEAGRKYVSLETGLAICVVLEMTPNELLENVQI